MGKIKKITENELVGGTQNNDVYPVTSVKAVYDESNERLDHILNRRGVVNISTNYNADHIAEVLTLEQAIAKVPSKDRVLGFTGTYLSNTGWMQIQFSGGSISDWDNTNNWISNQDRSTVKSIVFPQSNMVNIDLDNNKVIISAGNLYVTYYNSNSGIIHIQEQQIDISAKLNGNSALFFNLNNNTFEFLNFTEQYDIDDKYYIVALLLDGRIYYLSCDIYVNGKLFGAINAQNKVNDILSKVDLDKIKKFQDNIDTDTLPIIGFSNISIDINTSTHKFTYGTFNVCWGKGNYRWGAPSGSGTFIYKTQDVFASLSYILFNITTNEVAWVSFDSMSAYVGAGNTDWVILEILMNHRPCINCISIKSNGTKCISVADSLGERINDVADSLGDFFGNLVTGSDLVIGYNERDWNTLPINSLGTNFSLTREFNSEILKYVFKCVVRAGAKVPVTYWRSSIKTLNVNIPKGQKFTVGVRYKANNSNDAPIRLEVLGNGTWLNGLGGLGAFCPIQDGQWHYHRAEVSLDSADITSLSFEIFLSTSTAPYTYENDVTIEFTDLLVSTITAPSYALPKNEDDYKVLQEYQTVNGVKWRNLLWTNLVTGSDMGKGYDQANIVAFSTYPTLGGTVERVLDPDNSRYYIKATFPSGTKFTNSNNYVYPSLMKDVSFTGETTEQEFSISFRYKCSPNFIGFCPICNGEFMQILNYGSWGNMNASSIPLVRDNNWHYAHVIVRKTDVSSKVYSIGLFAYFAVGSAVVLEDDLEFGITDIVISPTRFTDFSDVKNPNDFGADTTEGNLTPIVNNIISKYPDAHGCVFMSLGDSITTEGYYINKLRQLLAPSKYYNLAVASATWADRTDTTSYDGDPQFTGDQNQNVLGNQLQKIINNPDVYNVAPDIIIISAGTNDGQPVPISTSLQDIIANIDTHFYANSSAIPITNPTFDDSDTYMNHRKTIAGSMRYVVCKLQEMYPNARIYILTPIQGCHYQRDYGSSIAAKQLYISEVAKHLGIPVIHVGEECGIQADFEYQGAMWTGPSGSNERSGRDLVDGLHPNTSGGWKMAKYIAKKLLNDYVNQSY